MKSLIAVLIAVCWLGLVGCNTVEGVGQDVKAAGKGIEHKAKEHKGY